MGGNGNAHKVGSTLGAGFPLLSETKESLCGKPAGVLIDEADSKGKAAAAPGKDGRGPAGRA